MSTHSRIHPTVKSDPEDSCTHRPSSEAGASGVFLGSIQAKRRHAHLCPDCNLLHQCECADGWKVAFVACGCRQ